MEGISVAETDSVADDLRAVWESKKGEEGFDDGGGLSAPDAPEPTPEPEADGDDTLEAAEKPAQPRDEHGRFAPKDGDAPAEHAVGGGEDTEEPEPLEPPADWSLEEQEAFRTLTPQGQKFVLDKAKAFQADYTKKTETVAQKEQRYQRLDGVLNHYRDEIARRGLDEAQAIGQLFDVWSRAQQNPAEFIMEFAASRNIDLAAFAQQPEGDDDDDAYTDPALKQALGKIAALEQQLQQVTGGIQQTQQSWQQREAQQRQQAMMSRLEQFQTAADDKGQPLHPYFDSVVEDMIERVQAIKARNPAAEIDLEDTYQRAVRANPETYAKLQAAEKANAARAAERERKEKARAAQQAGASVTGQPAGQSGAAPAGTVRDELMRAATQAFGRI